MRKYIQILLILASVSVIGTAKGQNPDWKIQASSYQFSMNITGVLVNSCTFSDNPGNRVAAFVGGELRGTATFSTAYNGMALAFLTIFSNKAAGETLTFKAWDSKQEQVVDLAVQLTFTENGVEGNPESPFQFYVDAPFLTGKLELENENTIRYSELIPNATYTWFKNGELLGSDKENALTICLGGIYKVEVAHASCSILKDSIQVEGSDQNIVVQKKLSDSKLSHIISVNACNESYTAYTYELMDGDEEENNHLFEIVGDTLKLKPSSDTQNKIDYKIRVKATDSFGNSFEQVIKVEYIALGIKDVSLAKKINVYPNPFNSTQLNVELPKDLATTVFFKLLTSEGVEVLSDKQQSATIHTLKLPENLPAGLYSLEIETKEQFVQKKLIKE